MQATAEIHLGHQKSVTGQKCLQYTFNTILHFYSCHKSGSGVMQYAPAAVRQYIYTSEAGIAP